MPRTVEEILAHADELAERFTAYEPRPEDEVEAEDVAKTQSGTGTGS